MRLCAIEHDARGNAGEFVRLHFVQTAAVDEALSPQLRRIGALQRASNTPRVAPDVVLVHCASTLWDKA